ncbi:MAG: lipid-A-disaccharide synthase [Reinekea sp.]|nr:lipid-A-disaccharide synthase [Reinekea sp.]
MSRPLRIALIAGESSGDTLGAGLIREIKKYHPDAEFQGIGGEKMIAEGLHSRVSMERLSVMGISEVLGRLSELLKIRSDFYRWCVDWQPDVFVGIDAPDFNLGLEIKLKAQGIKTVHYVSPSVWAWRKGRLKKIRKAVDHMLTLLPFEAEFYQRENIPVTFVGHTLADQLPMSSLPEQHRSILGIDVEVPLLAVLPGSRGSEVKQLLPLFLATVGELQHSIPGLHVVIPAANSLRREQIEQLLKPYRGILPVTVLDQQADLAIAASDAVLVASGTATLQTLLWKKPMVVAYRMSAFSYWLISSLATTRWVSLPNILEQRDWVPERLQEAATVEQLVSDLKTALADQSYRQAFVDRASYWHRELALNADEQAAKAVLSLVK